jgi:hypothetical protein
MNRSKSYDQELSDELQNPKAAQVFFLTLMEGRDGMSLEKALKHTIQRIGIKEFSKMSGIPSPNIIEFINGKRRPKPETLDVYLKPFRLKTKIIVEKAS